MKYEKLTSVYEKDYKSIIKLLWDDITDKEIEDLLNSHSDGKDIIFISIDNGHVVGFLNTSVRTDYVEGSSTDKTGYIEGIYVKEKYRNQKIAKTLINESINYFNSLNITEIGSDIDINNMVSKEFHEKIGFIEMSRNIHYLLKIK